jgi:hypothetical protein
MLQRHGYAKINFLLLSTFSSTGFPEAQFGTSPIHFAHCRAICSQPDTQLGQYRHRCGYGVGITPVYDVRTQRGYQRYSLRREEREDDLAEYEA